MITARRFRQGVAAAEPVDASELTDARGGPGTLLVVDIVDGSDAELTSIAGQLPIHPLAVEDLRTANQRTKLERYGDHFHVALHAASAHDHDVCVNEIDVVFGQDWFLVVRQPAEQGQPMELDEVVRRFERTRGEPDSDDLGTALWALLDVVVDGYFAITDLVDERLDTIEEVVFGDNPAATSSSRGTSSTRVHRDEIPQEVFELRRAVVRFRRAATPLREVLGELLRRQVEWLGPGTLVQLQDVYDHLLRIVEMVESQRDLLTGLLEAHLAVVSNRMNDVMKRTSSYGAILLVSTLIAGIYGMNFKYMPELKWHYGYFMALATMAVATIILWRQFRKRGWL